MTLVFNTAAKNCSIVSDSLAFAMLAMGNPHGYNRAKKFPAKDKNKMIILAKNNGYSFDK